jgi:hypothetical protein
MAGGRRHARGGRDPFRQSSELALRIILAVLAILIGAAVAAVIAGSSSWKRSSQGAIAQLVPDTGGAATFDAASVDHLPAPVAKYFRKAIPQGHPIVRAAIATQEAEFFINGGWRPLSATQRFSASPPGFVWDARIEMAPLMPAFVRDSYVGGHAGMQASIYGVYTIVNQIDKAELSAGALQRFLGEAVWLPTALLPSAALTWTARDDRSAMVALEDGATSVAQLFEFGKDDMPATITGDRFKENNGTYAMQPWQIHCDRTELRDGLRVPTHCEVAWVVNGVREPYWRGRITSIDYQYDQME